MDFGKMMIAFPSTQNITQTPFFWSSHEITHKYETFKSALQVVAEEDLFFIFS